MEEKYNKGYLRELAYKWKKGLLTNEEKQDLENWEKSHTDDLLQLPDDSGGPEAVKSRMLQHLLGAIQEESLPERKARVIKLWPRIAVAASILIACSIGLYIYEQHQTKPAATQIAKNDIAPGHNQATLTLANGKKIVLTKGLSGKLAQQGNTLVQVNSGNAIAYTAAPTTAAPAKIDYNTLSTRNGEKSPYPLVLADGTKIWLNAASSVTFPTAFDGNSRLVAITGEAYFEVAHNAAKPFRVTANGQTVEVLGTRFNINAYTDEPRMRTTLLEGSVRISKDDKTAMLVPGQEALVSSSSNKPIVVNEGDTEEAVAWKNNQFRFNDEKLGSIMRQVSRWYDVEVDYEDASLKEKPFAGFTTRFGKASELLNMLEMTGEVKFKIEGKKIIVQHK